LSKEKANKIIEILAAAIPMDAVFLGKLFAMLAVSMVGIAVWATVIGGFMGPVGLRAPVRRRDQPRQPCPSRESGGRCSSCSG
jgi:ABC-type Na+ efflux pump permease subunit